MTLIKRRMRWKTWWWFFPLGGLYPHKCDFFLIDKQTNNILLRGVDVGRIKAELNYTLVPDLGKVDIGQCIQLCSLIWPRSNSGQRQMLDPLFGQSGAGNVAMYSNCPVILSSHYVDVAREGEWPQSKPDQVNWCPKSILGLLLRAGKAGTGCERCVYIVHNNRCSSSSSSCSSSSSSSKLVHNNRWRQRCVVKNLRLRANSHFRFRTGAPAVS